MRYRPWLPLTAAAIVGLALTGCSAGGSARAGAEDTAARFLQAVADGDGSRACALLVRDARDAVETATRTSCERGVLRLGLTDERVSTGGDADADAGNGHGHGTGTGSARVYGRAAIIEDGPDTVFLARSGDTWLVRAAGCSPRTDAPFTCALDGS